MCRADLPASAIGNVAISAEYMAHNIQQLAQKSSAGRVFMIGILKERTEYSSGTGVWVIFTSHLLDFSGSLFLPQYEDARTRLYSLEWEFPRDNPGGLGCIMHVSVTSSHVFL